MEMNRNNVRKQNDSPFAQLVQLIMLFIVKEDDTIDKKIPVIEELNYIQL